MIGLFPLQIKYSQKSCHNRAQFWSLWPWFYTYTRTCSMYELSALCHRSGSCQKACPGTLLQITPFPPPLPQAKPELKILPCRVTVLPGEGQCNSAPCQHNSSSILPHEGRGTTFRHRQKDTAELRLSLNGRVLLTLPLGLLDNCFLCLHLKLPVQKMEKALIETENTFKINKYSIILTS